MYDHSLGVLSRYVERLLREGVMRECVKRAC